MAKGYIWLTMLLLAAGPARAQTPQDVSGAIYSIAKDMTKMQAQLEELRAMVAALSKKGGACHESAAVQPPPSRPVPPPASTLKRVAPSLPETAPQSSRGTVTGKVTFERLESKVAYVFLADVTEAPVKGLVKEIRQRRFKFHPDHLVVQSGTRINFPNDDKIHHNVFSVTPASSFDLGYSRSDDPTPSQLFVAPGLVDINCNIHPAMKAAVLVVPNRHHAPVQSDGSFSLVGVPLGRHTIKVWAPGAELGEKELVVHADRTDPITFTLVPRKGGSR
jgi:plastocyanin